MRRAWITAAAALTLLGLCHGPAAASPQLEEARALLADLDYEGTLRALQQALLSGKNAPDEIRSVYRLLGEVHASLGNAAEAERFFRNWLALDPDATLPAGSSPKLIAPLVAAQAYMSTRKPLAVRCEPTRQGTGLTLDVAADPTELIAGGWAAYRLKSGDETIVKARGTGSIVLRSPAAARAKAVCAAVDRHGNHLIEIGSWSSPVIVEPRQDVVLPGPEATSEASAPLYARWYLWGTLTAVALGSGGYFALELRNAQEEFEQLHANVEAPLFDDAQRIAERGEQSALLATISFGVAGACAAAALFLLFRDGGSDEHSGTAIAPLIMDDGGGIAVRAPF